MLQKTVYPLNHDYQQIFSSLHIALRRAYRASGSLQISFKGEPFFLGLAVWTDVEAGALANSVVCTGVWILTASKVFGDGKSLVTLLKTSCTWGNLSHHLTCYSYKQFQP